MSYELLAKPEPLGLWIADGLQLWIADGLHLTAAG